jgi:hypothetical protein
LAEIPSFVDSTLAAFSEHQISSVASLVKENLGVKGLKQLGLATPAAWALHSAVEKIGSSCATAPPPSTGCPDPAIVIEAVGIVIPPSPEPTQEPKDEEPREPLEPLCESSSTSSKKIWGYALEGGSSSSESDNEKAEKVLEGLEQKKIVEGSEVSQGGGECSYSWRRKFVVMDSSSSSDEERGKEEG